MKKLLIWLVFLFFFFNIEGKSKESIPIQKNVEDIFNIGKMLSHDNKFVLFFKSRDKAVLAKGQEFNYITDYPQDLYIYYNETKETIPLITYDWFPKKAKKLSYNLDFPIFPEDFAYYLLNDNETIIMISGMRAIKSNFQFNLKNKKLSKLEENDNYQLLVSSLLKNCGYKDMHSTYQCSYYRPLISFNLIN